MLERLRQITQEVNLASDTQQALQIVVRKVCETLGIEVSSIYLADYQTQQLVLMATEGLNPKAAGVLQLNFNQGIVGLIAQREEPINLEDASSHPNFHYFPEAGEEPFQALLGAPIIHQRKVMGVLVAQQKQRRKFSETEENFLVTLAAQLAGIIAESKKRDKLSDHSGQYHVIRKLDGFPAAAGIAIGEAVVFYPRADLSSIPDKQAKSQSAELKRIKKAFRLARKEIAAMKARMESALGEEELSLFDAYARILDENGLQRDVIEQLDLGHWAPGALRRAVEQHTRIFETMDDPYFRERASDLIDLARRVLVYLEDDQTARPKLIRQAILVAEEITAGLLAELPTEKIKGMVSMNGSPTSHAAILAKALGIPAVCGLDNVPINRFEGQEIILDGYKGLIYLSPNESLKKQYQQLIKEDDLISQDLEQYTNQKAITKDGVHLPLMVNAGLIADFEKSLDVGADGVGLYRTEIPFLMREQFPSEEEQIRIYRAALQAYQGKSVTFRTLDIGGDKQLSYFPIEEANPFLGWRGIRVTLDHPEIFLVQVRAILKASQGFDNIRISLPMISSVEEVDESLCLIDQAFYEVQQEQPQLTWRKPEVGIILEVPSAMYQIPAIVKRVNFISVGSNDLSQYLLAVDRNNTRVSSLYSNYHPSVIRALAFIRQQVDANTTGLYLCGEMAGDPMAVLVLLGMQYDALSMNARSIPKIKKIVQNFSLDEAKAITEQVLQTDKAKDIHDILFQNLLSKDLAGLVRAGH
ncbi:phosphoenolpyruvate--protein phosphotransferase [Pleionea litopenaei]|uniref:phosphoenolpyruvate--protein phosphotransferase n=1 Tax=Pleionea litopenaei TaxID=3070815 RepID=A0AA51RQM7_9GAMM|nr:phosphoenolpyruvate--protein phosphotransferase [Pleionea sp. HL-JVS1]WMS85757.1 phosphoenolpyruvate--protein phosphotransferase [Pleionea sp. HL-JVS1]